MSHNKVRYGVKSIATLLVLASLLLVFAPVALAASEQVAATTALNVRSGPGANYNIVGSLKKGETVTRVGTSGSWSIIEYNGRRAYAHSAYLKVVSAAPPVSKPTMYATAATNVRSGPGTNYRVVGTLKKGDAVTKLSMVGSWAIIDWYGDTAYVPNQYLTSSNSSGSNGPSTSPASGVMEATTNVNVRSGPSSSFSKLGALTSGERVTRTGIVGSWTQVNYRGQTAYVHSSYLRLVDSGTTPDPGPNPNPASGTMEATVDVNVRSGPGTNYSTRGTLYRGERVERMGVTGNWTQVLFRGSTAYIFSSYLKKVAGDEPLDEKRYIQEDTVMRLAPYSYSWEMMQLKAGDIVILISTTGSWSLVEYGNNRGYVLASLLGKSKPQAPTGVAYALSRADVRMEPNSSSGRLGYLEVGEGVQRKGTSGSWTIVAYKTYTGYVLTSNVVIFTASEQTNFTTSDKTLYANERTQTYTVPDARSAYAYGWIEQNETVVRKAYNSTWTKLLHNGRTLYVRTSALRDDVADASGMAYATSTQDVRAEPNTTSRRLGTLTVGDNAVRTGVNGSWTRITYLGQVGYVQTAKIAVLTGSDQVNFTTLTKSMYVKSASAPIYIIPDAKNTYLYATLSKNDQAERTAYNNTWSRITVQGRIYYIATSALSDTTAPTGYEYNDPMTITNVSGARMYSDPGLATPHTFTNTSGTLITLIPTGAVVRYRASVGSTAYEIYWPTEDVRVYISAADIR